MSTVILDEQSNDTSAAGAELHYRVADFYARYAECLNDDEIEKWPDFFVEDCLYKLMPRANHDRGLPISIMLSESRGGLVDRVTAIRNTMVYAPRWTNLSISNPRIVSRSGDIVTTHNNFTVYHTSGDGVSMLLLVGRSFDKIEVTEDRMWLVERVAIYDTELLPATIIYPV